MNQEIRASLKEIWQKHRGLAAMLVIMWVLALAAVIISLVLLEPKYLRTLSSYTNLGIVNYYLGARWWHAIIFPIASLGITFFWTILALQLYRQKSAKFAKIFIFLSYFVLVTLGVTMVRVLLFNAELS
ncbi:MAG: hypothetical protein LBM12_00535 [Candidatus Nomurabacteria bacterium]|jgi:hypothetical protein|nr:hypothetical protein [Candidatus Nomurabacteria bacterium]